MYLFIFMLSFYYILYFFRSLLHMNLLCGYGAFSIIFLFIAIPFKRFPIHSSSLNSNVKRILYVFLFSLLFLCAFFLLRLMLLFDWLFVFLITKINISSSNLQERKKRELGNWTVFIIVAYIFITFFSFSFFQWQTTCG